MSQSLFDRAYTLSIGPPNQTTALQYSNIPSPTGAISPLRVVFEIEKNNLGSSGNHSKVAVYNLSSESRQKISAGWSVQLQAGYQSIYETVFIGNIFKTHSERKGADIVTFMECIDGGAAIGTTFLHKSYGSGTSLYQILQDLAAAMSITSAQNPTGVDAGLVIGLPDYKIGYSFTASGPCKDTLEKLLKPFNLSWSVQNNSLTIIPLSAFSGTAVLISKKTGLTGVPSFNLGIMKFQCLLNPQVKPNAIVQLISENTLLNGFYKITKAKYDGDSHNKNKWNIDCEAFKVPVNTQTYPSSAGFNYSGAVV